MTYQEREEIFSKEILHISDVAELFGCAPSTASALILSWKRKILFSGKDLRVELDGRIHILDYFDVMNINGEDPGERYFRKKPKGTNAIERYDDKAPARRRSVCV